MQTRKELVVHTGPDLRPEGMTCRGCGGPLKEVPQTDAIKVLRRFTEERYVPVRSFQCDRCEVILTANELTMGRFVPPQFRLETRATEIGDPDRPLPLLSGNEIMVTVGATGSSRSKRA
jgi:hypothetical protein